MRAPTPPSLVESRRTASERKASVPVLLAFRASSTTSQRTRRLNNLAAGSSSSSNNDASGTAQGGPSCCAGGLRLNQEAIARFHARVLHSCDDQDLPTLLNYRQSSVAGPASPRLLIPSVLLDARSVRMPPTPPRGWVARNSACLRGPPSQRSLQRSATALCGKRATRFSQPVRGIEHAARTHDAANSAHLAARGAA